VTGRWTALIRSLDAEAEFGAPADESSLRSCAAVLAHPLPEDLVAALRESDGVTAAYGIQLLWPVAQIVEDNLWVRSFVGPPGQRRPVRRDLLLRGAGGKLFRVRART
jgi:hypothetical protein